MLKFIKRLVEKILDDVVWVVVSQDNKQSIRMTWSRAKDMVKISGGKIWHYDDLSPTN